LLDFLAQIHILTLFLALISNEGFLILQISHRLLGLTHIDIHCDARVDHSQRVVHARMKINFWMSIIMAHIFHWGLINHGNINQ
jgi:hypothetical protein